MTARDPGSAERRGVTRETLCVQAETLISSWTLTKLCCDSLKEEVKATHLKGTKHLNTKKSSHRGERKMKVLLLLPVTVFMTAGLIAFVNMRQKEQEKSAVRSRFQDIKLRVTRDMLEEFQKEVADMMKNLDEAKKDQTTVQEGEKDLQSKVESKKGEADACLGGQVRPE